MQMDELPPPYPAETAAPPPSPARGRLVASGDQKRRLTILILIGILAILIPATAPMWTGALQNYTASSTPAVPQNHQGAGWEELVSAQDAAVPNDALRLGGIDHQEL